MKNTRIAAAVLTLMGTVLQPASAQQSPIAPVRLEWKPGSGNIITITVSGVEQDLAEVKEQWSDEDACLVDLQCFVASWIEANRSGDVQHIMTLRDPSERAALQKIMDKQPQSLSMNSARFKVMRKWSYFGYLDYGPFRVALLAYESDSASKTAYTLPLRRSVARWAQTDGLADDNELYAILDRVADVVMHRHDKSARPK